MAERSKDIFMSYVREDGVREFARELKIDLERNGVSVWLDVDDIPTGSDFHVEIGVALNSCRALVPILTKKYVHSRYCKGELYVANSREKILLPVIYEDGWDEGEEGAGVNYIVAAYNWAFFRPNKDDYKSSLEKLLHGIKLKLGGGIDIRARGENQLAEKMIDEHVRIVDDTPSTVIDKKVAVVQPTPSNEGSSDLVPASTTTDQDGGTPSSELKVSPTDAVSSQIQKFEERFENLGFATMTELEEKELDIKRFRHSLVLLPAKIKKEHTVFLKENLPAISKAETIDEIFLQLNLYWNFIDYSLLSHIVSRFCSEELKTDMSTYVTDLETFQKSTTISQMIQSWPGRLDPPPNFSRVTCKLNRDASTYTLHELDQLRVNFCHEFSLSNSIMMLHSFIKGSVIVVWIIPTGCVNDLRGELFNQGSMNPTFFEENEIVSVSIDESLVYVYMPYTVSPASPTSRNYYFEMTHSLHSWWPQLSDLSLKTAFINLSSKQIDGLVAEGQLSAEQQQVLAALDMQIDLILRVFEGDGAIIHVNGRSINDTILELNDPQGLTTGPVHDAISHFRRFESDSPDPYPWRIGAAAGESDNLENEVLRAYQRAVNTQYPVNDGKKALDMLRSSTSIKNHLSQLKPFSLLGADEVQFTLSVTEFNRVLAEYPGVEFRAFVYQNVLRALSQIDTVTFYPYVNDHKIVIRRIVEESFIDRILPHLKDLENYVVDIMVAPDQEVRVTKLHPLNPSTDPSLFTWSELSDLFVREQGMEFRTVDVPKTLPDVFSQLQPSYAAMLEQVLHQQQRRHRHRGAQRGGYEPRRKYRACVLM